MRTVGLIGGMSWESTAVYYRLLNEGIREKRGGLHSAPILLHSHDFAVIEALQAKGEWQKAGQILTVSGQLLQEAGADFLMLCTNTMHKVLSFIEESVSVPILHIADATAIHLQEAGVTCVGLLGTRFTMEEDFYRSRLENEYDLQVVIPDQEDRLIVDRVIFEELCQGNIKARSRDEYYRIIETLGRQGAEAVILGCTEIAMLVDSDHSSLPLYDTTKLHVIQAISLMLNEGED